jgi:hypothetical protein
VSSEVDMAASATAKTIGLMLAHDVDLASAVVGCVTTQLSKDDWEVGLTSLGPI